MMFSQSLYSLPMDVLHDIRDRIDNKTSKVRPS